MFIFLRLIYYRSIMEPMTNSKNLLECAYYWEKKTPDRVYFTQPMGGGDINIKTWTWKEAIGEARRMATYLKSLNFRWSIETLPMNTLLSV